MIDASSKKQIENIHKAVLGISLIINTKMAIHTKYWHTYAFNLAVNIHLHHKNDHTHTIKYVYLENCLLFSTINNIKKKDYHDFSDDKQWCVRRAPFSTIEPTENFF